ncbi:MAG: hypothetical protein ACXWWB_03450 [Nitrospira sp.]
MTEPLLQHNVVRHDPDQILQILRPVKLQRIPIIDILNFLQVLE